MTTESLEVIAQLKADYHKRRSDQADSLTKKILDGTKQMHDGILKAVREHPKIAILEPFAKLDVRADDDGAIPMSTSITVEIPEHAPIFLFFNRNYQIRAEDPIAWILGNNQHPVTEVGVWLRGPYATYYYRHDPWDLGEILAIAEERYVEYFHCLERDEQVGPNKIQPPLRPEITPTDSELALVKAMRDLFYENGSE